LNFKIGTHFDIGLEPDIVISIWVWQRALFNIYLFEHVTNQQVQFFCLWCYQAQFDTGPQHYFPNVRLKYDRDPVQVEGFLFEQLC